MAFLSFLYWDPKPIAFTLPFLNHPIAWYGILFAGGFFLSFLLFRSLLEKCFTSYTKEYLNQFSEKLAFSLMVGTVLGARLGHLLFYENWEPYLRHPLLILKTWEGGLASHGGLIGLGIALLIFFRRWKKKIPALSFFLFLDLLAAPAFLCGFFIRLGNFVNQEILGKVTSVPWAVVFQTPAGGGLPLPRHPVQLYEALFYFAAFLFFLRFFPYFSSRTGRGSGYAITLTFLFRFFIEFFKEEQSRHLLLPYLTMGQYLSLPLILLGIFFVIRSLGKEKERMGSRAE